MSKLLLISIFFSLIQTTFGQNKEVNIDKLDTKNDIEALIYSIDKRYAKFELKSIGEFKSRYRKTDFCKRISDSLEITKSFYKSDFDNNGLTDILTIGNYYNFNVLVIMNFGKDSLKINRLSRRNYQNCAFPKIVNDTIIDYHYQTDLNWVNKEKTELTKKSLIYKFGGFIELNQDPIDNKIEKIEYYTSMCLGTCPKFDITINQDKTSIFIAQNYNFETRESKEIKGEFNTTISYKSFKEIIDLLNYLNFPELKENYSINVTDHPTSNLKITYNNGKIKKIRDYGMIGTYGLDRLYELFFELRFNQDWK